MPKWGENSKKTEAKDREQQKKNEKKHQEDKKKQEEIWKETDPKVLKKQAKEQEKREKERQQKEKQLEKKQLYEEEIQQISSNKSKLNTKEIRILKEEVAKVNLKNEQALQEKYQPDYANDDSDDLDEQLNKEFNYMYKMQGIQSDGMIVADNLDKALTVLTIDGQVDKHPEKRVKGAWKAFVDEQLSSYRKEYSSLKRNQVLNIMWKEFEKSERNPMNNANNFVWNKKKKIEDE